MLDNFILAKISNNSMSPLIDKGNTICIDLNAPFEDGKIAVANINSGFICGKAYKTANGYELKNEVGDTLHTHSICGIVIWKSVPLEGGEEE